MKKLSQSEVILRELKKRKWVSLPQILSLKTSNGSRIASHTKAISELRSKGYDIINWKIWSKKREEYISHYHLVK